jgi:hypothetical protein
MNYYTFNGVELVILMTLCSIFGGCLAIGIACLFRETEKG